jgi:transposase
MLTWGEAVEVHALRERGWSIAAIARHLDRDPKTIRAYVNGERGPGRRRRQAPDPLAPFTDYLAARFVDDPHIWASALYDEVRGLGYRLSYVSFARQLRTHRLRPHCQACSGVRGRPTIQIDHPPGAELQWDWFERRRAPWGGTAYVLLGSLPHSGRIRGVLAEATDQPHLVEAIDGVLRRFGGTARTWRTDRLATVIVPGTRDVQPSFVPVAKHYGVAVEPCPSRRANRKGLGGVGSAVCVRPLVADHDRHDDGRGARVAGSVPGHRRRCPASAVAGRRHRWSRDRGCAGRRRAAAGPSGRALPGHCRGRPPGGHRRDGGLLR